MIAACNLALTAFIETVYLGTVYPCKLQHWAASVTAWALCWAHPLPQWLNGYEEVFHLWLQHGNESGHVLG